MPDRLREEGKIEGKQEGKKEGKLEGKLEGKRESVLRALEIRHGGYPAGIREAVDGIHDPAALDGLLESAFRSDSLEEFAQKL